MTERLAKKVLLIGWDAADWQLIHPLMDAGKMPNLAALVQGGVMGNISTLYPEYSPMLWTSIATGKRAFKHGILGFTEPDPHGRGVRPVSSLSRKTKALWNILSQVGFRSNVIGWWPSHPVEPIRGVMVSNHYQRAVAPFGEPWPMLPNTVHPKRISGNLERLRLHPQELDPALIMSFLPKLAEIDQDQDHRVESVAKITAETCNLHRAAAAIMHHEPWDFTAVYFDGIDHYCHGFMNYHPPRLDWIRESDFEQYKLVVEGGYIYHDILLGQLLAEAGAETTVILVSDHGFTSDHLRLQSLPDEPAGPAAQHRHYGVIVMNGPGIKQDELLFGTTLLDICPTILSLFGLPVGEDMDGNPLVNAFEAPEELATIPSWDQVPGEDGSHSAARQLDPVQAREELKQLVDLGYIEEPDPDREKAMADTTQELQYNLARAFMDANRYEEAVEILRKLVEARPDESRFALQLVLCYRTLGHFKDARLVLDEAIKQHDKYAGQAREQLLELSKLYPDGLPPDLPKEKIFELRSLQKKAAPLPSQTLEYLKGVLAAASGDPVEALAHLRKAVESDSRQPGLHVRIGEVYLRMQKWRQAEKSFKRALELDPDFDAAHLGLCRALLPRRRPREAAEAAFTAVGLVYFNPQAHFWLAKALSRVGRSREAIEALGVALSQNPHFPKAHRLLAGIYRRQLGDEQKAEEHQKLARQAAKRLAELSAAGGGGLVSPVQPPEIMAPRLDRSAGYEDGVWEPDNTVFIVSGLPRSGTSMMMQMLASGGLPILSDGVRAGDEQNPRGYLEFEAVKYLARDGSWLSGAGGKAVKIVAPLLPFLPGGDNVQYRVIFMERDLAEVAASQRIMLDSLGRRGGDLAGEQLIKSLADQAGKMQNLLAARRIPTLVVDYNRCVEEPLAAAEQVGKFLGGLPDPDLMATVVDPALHRQRVEVVAHAS